MKRALVLTLVLVAGCGGGGDGGGDNSGPAKIVSQTQTTKVQVVKSSGAAARGFDPGTIYTTEGPGVVTLIAVSGTRSSEALGSGFVVDAEGYIATNAHVVTGDSGTKAKAVYVQFADGNKVEARIIGTDLNSDLALLKVNPSDLRGANAKIVPLPFGSTSEIKVGDPVAAIGSPFGEEQSLSVGVVSALNRDIESLTSFSIGNAIQTDAAINHGNSGGPLLDGGGKVIGVNAQIQSTGGGGEGVGFAIPVETVKRSIEQMRAQGHVDYAYLGISSVSLYPQLADHLKINASDGALIDGVARGGPADKAGIHGADDHITFQGVPRVPVGSDLITAIDGHELTHAADLSDVIGVHRPGDSVKLTLVRDGKKRTVSVTLAKRPESPASRR
jgi:S1-C subfamily serine protease